MVGDAPILFGFVVSVGLGLGFGFIVSAISVVDHVRRIGVSACVHVCMFVCVYASVCLCAFMYLCVCMVCRGLCGGRCANPV